MQTAATNRLDAFRRDEQGTIIPTFGVMFIAITMAAGVGLDFGRLHHASTRMTAAADAAAIAAAKALLDGRNDDADIKLIAKRFFEENLAADKSFSKIDGFSADIDRSTNTITVNLKSKVPTTIMKIAGIDDVSLPVTSVATFQQRDIELALALDVTGSMRGRKLRDLKTATAELVDIMLPDAGTANKVRLAFAPYSNGVNAGTYADASTGGRAGNRCTYERQGVAPEKDHAPGPDAYLAVDSDVPGSDCPNAAVVGLTSDKRLLKATVRGYVDGGTTAGHLGAQWASYLVSPNWGGVLGGESEPVAYNDGKTVKAIVLMTDGEFNTWDGMCDTDRRGNQTCNPYGERGRKSNERAKEICEAAKLRGVVVYSIGFEIGHPAALDTLGKCASSPLHFFRAENGDELRQAFASIGASLSNLRLAK